MPTFGERLKPGCATTGRLLKRAERLLERSLFARGYRLVWHSDVWYNKNRRSKVAVNIRVSE